MASTPANVDASILHALRQGRTAADFWLPRLLALSACVVGPLPLILDLKWRVPMSTIGPIFWVVSILLVITSVALASRAGDRGFLRMIVVGLLAGYMATATYDSSRVAGMSAGFVSMDEALDFGQRLTGQIAPGGHGSMHVDGHEAKPGHEESTKPAAKPVEAHGSGAPHGEHQQEAASTAGHKQDSSISRGTVALGYAWHYWSGILFSLSFLVLFGARGWKWAVPYLVFVIYPGMVFAMGSHTVANFIWEAIGHAGFGLTLGIVSSALLNRPAEKSLLT